MFATSPALYSVDDKRIHCECGSQPLYCHQYFQATDIGFAFIESIQRRNEEKSLAVMYFNLPIVHVLAADIDHLNKPVDSASSMAT